jgi:hypothetical protein
MLGSAIINWAILLPKKHPEDDSKPLINFEFALIFVPFMLVGTTMGVILNTILPMIVSSLFFILVFGITAFFTTKKAISVILIERSKNNLLQPLLSNQSIPTTHIPSKKINVIS